MSAGGPPHYEEGGGVEVTGLGKQQVCQVQPRFLEVHIWLIYYQLWMDGTIEVFCVNYNNE